jgi:hypothetical protein
MPTAEPLPSTAAALRPLPVLLGPPALLGGRPQLILPLDAGTALSVSDPPSREVVLPKLVFVLDGALRPAVEAPPLPV